ncbi:glycoside hydrolase family 15 protein [soil metagenome]
MSGVPLAQHGLLSDCGGAALVTSTGSVDWLCMPRFDQPPIFARLLDDDAGHFSIRPSDPSAASTWSYRPNSLVLETAWTTESGTLLVNDALALGKNERGHDLGRWSPGVLLRRVRCTSGSVSVDVEFAPRPEFGLIHPRLTQRSGAVVADGGATVLLLSTQLELGLGAGTGTGSVCLGAGEEVTFALEQTDAWESEARTWKRRKVGRRLRDTESAWQSWSRLHQNYQGPLRELVQHSGVVLQGLTYARSGSIVAAPTTSLPEGVGSERTWDYRFSWVRDASMTMQGLYVAACPDEGGRFFSFISRAAASQLDEGLHLQIMFGIRGERDLTECGLPHLAGWRGSGPVRVGNGAWDQHQLDVYGALLDAAHTLRAQLGSLDEETRLFLVAAVDAAAARWGEDDQGIWEFRGSGRPFLYSKLMCWVAVDRGIAMADQLRPVADKLEAWTAVRDEIRREIEERGWSEEVGAYTQSFGSSELDASVLMMAIVGFLPPDDPRLRATIDVVAEGLSDENGLLRRYAGDDGIQSSEGSFLLCTFWLAHALAITGQVQRAREVLERAAGTANGLGLLAEQVDATTGELLGNYPQAFSHLGLVNAAQALAEAEQQGADA